MPKISDVDSRDLLLFFVNAATITSYKLNEDVNVANKNKIKNKLKNKLNPKIEKLSKTLEESADGIATTNIIMPKISDVYSRDLLLFFVNAATITSYKLNEDVNVANKNKIKNKLKNKLPKGICPKASGNTINNKLGP